MTNAPNLREMFVFREAPERDRIDSDVKQVHMVFFDAGGGHRSAATALRRVIEQRSLPWEIRMLNLQDLFESLDIFKKIIGLRSEDLYNFTLKKGWTLGSTQMLHGMHALIGLYHRPQMRLLKKYWARHQPDLVVSLIPNFNRALYQSLQRAHPGVPMMTVMTDFADCPPHFWMERRQSQFIVCGTDRASEQARKIGYPEERILKTSGMIVNPDFYDPIDTDRREGRRALGLDDDTPTGLVLFGGHGSKAMNLVARRLDASELPVQLILICGHNQKLADKLRSQQWRMRVRVEGFTREMSKFMHLADFFIGKPGPGSISEALRMGLPVIVERNAWTLPQERYNAEWVTEKQVGIVLKSFREVVHGVRQMLEPATLAELRKNIAAQENRAIFEIPEILAKLLGEAPTGSAQQVARSTIHAGV
jgi:UDP-N-acetylglucosamine:LPS N-acetylglucosamine transferase